MSPALITRSLFLLVPFLCCAPVSAQTTYTWTGGDVDDSWFSPLNWSAVGQGSPPPLNNIASTFVVLSGNTRTTNTLDYSFSANSLTFSATGGAFVVGTTTAETLTLGVGGITIVAGNPNNQTFNANLALGADQLWVNNGTGTFTVGGAIDTAGFALTSAGTGNSTFNGIISGTGSLTKTGPGKLTLGGVNTWTGPLIVNGGGTVSIDNQTRLNSSATTPITLNNGTIEETNPGANGTFTPVGRN